MKKVVSLLIAVLLLVSACAAFAEGSYKIAVVPKMTSIAWFERMEVGVNEYNEANGTDYFYGGSVEGADQAAYVESLLGAGYDALCVVPFDTEALDPILAKAREMGIVVITHEAAGLQNVDYDIEAFDNTAYGEHFMAAIGEKTGGTGEYIQIVGALTSASHMQWIEGAQAYQEANFPDMKQVGTLESADNQSTAYDKVKEALTANPNIVAIQGSAMGDVAGAALAVEELGLAGQVTIIGTSLVSVSGKYVEDGTISMIGFWDPALAGQAMIELAIATLEGRAEDGMSLPVEGYNDLALVDNVFYANAWIDVDASNVADEAYNF
ncbi:MAG TPA: substrate-binding domain-containing protein [Candidatus Pullichristensenella excrementigallinarum]|uniref:Substrate-binding domain-containing protein n=1 Tax=Candidatus Pullichristensenella excrementigallinarum TaxID=2840907 RepID=A0A9D1LCU8_9FIRM|nr:substrate-binding domain-containing protein [Candidatus Pullichristensenella excrementigallinarum]